jgi:small-conductance mechanosensitive channel
MDARTKAARARRDFNDICRATRLLKYVMDVLRAVTSTPIWVIAALFVISALGMAIGGPGYVVALIATAGIAVYFLAWVLLYLLLPVAKGYAQLLLQATADLTAAIEEVIRNCPANCRGDVSAPSCDLG